METPLQSHQSSLHLYHNRQNGRYSRSGRKVPLQTPSPARGTIWCQGSDIQLPDFLHRGVCVFGGFCLWVYDSASPLNREDKKDKLMHNLDNQGMFGQILNMSSFSETVHPESIADPVSRGLLTACVQCYLLMLFSTSLK